jgi:hypothetical protein
MPGRTPTTGRHMSILRTGPDAEDAQDRGSNVFFSLKADDRMGLVRITLLCFTLQPVPRHPWSRLALLVADTSLSRPVSTS